MHMYCTVQYIETNRVHTIPKGTQMPYHSIYVDWIKLKLKENNIFAYQPAKHTHRTSLYMRIA